MSCFCGACWHSHIKGERSIGPVEFAAGPTNGRGLLSLDLLPHAGAVRAFQAEIVKVSRGRQFKRRVAFLLEFDAANRPGGEALWHELEFVAVLDITSHRGRIELGLDPQKISVRLGEMFGREIRREHTSDVFERQLEKARRNRAAKKR